MSSSSGLVWVVNTRTREWSSFVAILTYFDELLKSVLREWETGLEPCWEPQLVRVWKTVLPTGEALTAGEELNNLSTFLEERLETVA